MPHVVIVTDRVHFTTVRQEMRRAVGGRYRSWATARAIMEVVWFQGPRA